MRSRYELLRLKPEELLAVADGPSEEAPEAARCVVHRAELAETDDGPYTYRVTIKLEFGNTRTNITLTAEHLESERGRLGLLADLSAVVRHSHETSRFSVVEIRDVSLEGECGVYFGLTRAECEERDRQLPEQCPHCGRSG